MKRYLYLLPLCLLLLIFSCERVPVVKSVDVGGIEVTEGSQSLLVSEVLESADSRKLLNSPVQLKNVTKQKATIQLTGTGCSCYGVLYKKKRLSENEAFHLAAGEMAELHFEAAIPAVQASKSYSANFNFITSQGEENVQTNCTLNVYQDVRISPNVITSEAEYGVGGTRHHKLTVQRTLRKPIPDSVTEVKPQLLDLPENVSITKVSQLGEIEVVDYDLSRLSWEVELDVKVSAEAEPDAIPITYQVQFEDSPKRSNTQGQLVIRSRSPIAFPKTVHLGTIPLGTSRSRRFMISSPEEIRFRLTPDKDLADSLQLTVDQELKTRHLLEVKLVPGSAGEFDERVSFQTGLKEMPTIEVHFKALVE